MKLCRFFKSSLLILAGLTVSFISCGIDDYIVLEQVTQSDVTVVLGNSRVTVRLPSQSTYFRNYEIYYRIYASGIPISGTIAESQLSGINSTLASDYNAIKPYTNPDTNTTTNVGSVLTGRRYYTLDNSIPSNGFSIDFALTETITEPVLNSQPLRRNSTLTNPQPNRSFLNHADLYSAGNVNLNGDVQTSSTGTPMYTYVCMYIVATGVDNNYSTIYSKPTFIGVFMLPDPR
jgi:hypothetical protein